MLPARFVGVWDRGALIVDGEPVAGAGRSLWFQAGTRFVDVRGAGGGLPSEAFAGETAWDPTTQTLTWHHDLDMHPGSRDDSGRVEWRGGDLIEHGSAEQFGETIGYSEVWHQRAVPGHVVTVAKRTDGRGAAAWCGHLGIVTIDDRPNGSLRGGTFVQQSWGLAFDVVHGPPLPREKNPPHQVALGAAFDWWGVPWTVTDLAVVSDET